MVMKDITDRLRITAGMITMCEKIEWGSECVLMNEAATTIESLRAEVERLRGCNPVWIDKLNECRYHGGDHEACAQYSGQVPCDVERLRGGGEPGTDIGAQIREAAGTTYLVITGNGKTHPYLPIPVNFDREILNGIVLKLNIAFPPKPEVPEGWKLVNQGDLVWLYRDLKVRAERENDPELAHYVDRIKHMLAAAPKPGGE